MEEELISRHQEEREMYQKELEDGLPKKAKDSILLLDLKNQREVLSKQKSYIDAHIVHENIERLEQEEQEVFEEERRHKINNQINHLVQKQNQEFNALRLKIQKGNEEQQIDKDIEADRYIYIYIQMYIIHKYNKPIHKYITNRLYLKYKVVTKDVKNRQTTENNYMVKAFNNPGMVASRYMTQSKFNQSKSNFKQSK